MDSSVVRSASAKEEITVSIVSAVKVDVVDWFCIPEIASNTFCHNTAVFLYPHSFVASLFGNPPVSIFKSTVGCSLDWREVNSKMGCSSVNRTCGSPQ